MDEYISRDAAIELIRKVSDAMGFETPANAIECVLQIIRRIPAADARPVVRGEWITKERHEHYPSGKVYEADYCSICGKRGSKEYDFCPNCGAEMRGGSRDA